MELSTDAQFALSCPHKWLKQGKCVDYSPLWQENQIFLVIQDLTMEILFQKKINLRLK